MLSKEEALFLHRMDIRQNIQNPRNLERILLTKDYEDGLERMRRGVQVGLAIGVVSGVVKYLGIFPVPIMTTVAFCINVLAKSATAGIVYTTSSTASSVLRGNVDGPLNHFVSGFFTTLFVLKPPFFYGKIVAATFLGLNTAYLKFVYTAPKINRYVDNRHVEEGLRKRFTQINYNDMFNISTEHRKKDIEHLEKYL